MAAIDIVGPGPDVPWLLGTSKPETLVRDADGLVVGWRFHLPDGTLMMVPLVPVPD